VQLLLLLLRCCHWWGLLRVPMCLLLLLLRVRVRALASARIHGSSACQQACRKTVSKGGDHSAEAEIHHSAQKSQQEAVTLCYILAAAATAGLVCQ
jgi:Na+-transporting NADH:ubiquinone oxidoreductase subunit NqrF